MERKVEPNKVKSQPLFDRPFERAVLALNKLFIKAAHLVHRTVAKAVIPENNTYDTAM